MKEKELFREFYNKVYPIWKSMTAKYNRLNDESQRELEKCTKQKDKLLNIFSFCWIVVNIIVALVAGLSALLYSIPISLVICVAWDLIFDHKIDKKVKLIRPRYEKELNELHYNTLAKIKPIVEEYDLISLEDTMNGTYATVMEMIESKRADTVKEALLLIDEENRRKEQSKNEADMMKKLKEIRENTRHPSTNYYDD